MIVVASLQIYRAKVSHLTPWKGGGFGMFSTIESGSTRFLRATLTIVASDGSALDVPVELPRNPEVDELVLKCRAEPNPHALNELALLTLRQNWQAVPLKTMSVVGAGNARAFEVTATGNGGSEHPIRVSAMTLALYSVRLAPRSRTLKPTLLFRVRKEKEG